MLALLVLTLALLASAWPAFADRRVALLIGNGEYSAVPALANPHSDVKLLKSALEAAGFDEVRTTFDLGQKPLLKALNAFADLAADADIAVIYYSGHGMEIGGVNYLVPVDARLASDVDVPDETVTLERAMQALDGAKRLKLVILDACRTNPFLASMKVRGGRKAIQNGLAPFEPADADSLVAFAAKAGTPAYDGGGDNSPFAVALARRLVAPGDDVEIALRKVRDDVLAATDNRQEPFSYGSLSGSVIPLSKVAPAAQVGLGDAQTAYDAAMGAGTIEALDAFLTKYAEGGLAKSARRERDRLAKLAAIEPLPVATSQPKVPCGGVTSVSLASRGIGALLPDEACALKPGEVFRECRDCPDMVVVPVGAFDMGSSKSDIDAGEAQANEGPQHRIAVNRRLAVARSEVTRDQFDAFVAATNYAVGNACYTFENATPLERADRSYRNPGFPQTGQHPAVCISWTDAERYAEWLSRATGGTYRLPTEAEYEYAARAGSASRYGFGNDASEMCHYANGADQSASTVGLPSDQVYLDCRDGFAYTAPVRSFQANAFGLYDLIGNVWEWTADCYADDYASASPDGSSRAGDPCAARTVRGGSWSSPASFLRPAARAKAMVTNRYDDMGFRVVRELAP